MNIDFLALHNEFAFKYLHLECTESYDHTRLFFLIKDNHMDGASFSMSRENEKLLYEFLKARQEKFND